MEKSPCLLSQQYIVLVDDNSLDLFINQKMIEMSGINARVETVNGGPEAVAYLESCRSNGSCPTILLLDVNMPVLTGFQVLETCRQKGYLPEDILVIMLTSSVHPGDKQQAEELGTCFMEKPLTPAKLHAFIKQIPTAVATV